MNLDAQCSMRMDAEPDGFNVAAMQNNDMASEGCNLLGAMLSFFCGGDKKKTRN